MTRRWPGPKKPTRSAASCAAIERGKEVLDQAQGDQSAAASELAKQIVQDLSPEAKDRAAWVTISRLLLAD